MLSFRTEPSTCTGSSGSSLHHLPKIGSAEEVDCHTEAGLAQLAIYRVFQLKGETVLAQRNFDCIFGVHADLGDQDRYGDPSTFTA